MEGKTKPSKIRGERHSQSMPQSNRNNGQKSKLRGKMFDNKRNSSELRGLKKIDDK